MSSVAKLQNDIELAADRDDSLRSSSVVFFHLPPPPPAFIAAHLNWNLLVNLRTINVNIFHVSDSGPDSQTWTVRTTLLTGSVFGQWSIISKSTDGNEVKLASVELRVL